MASSEEQGTPRKRQLHMVLPPDAFDQLPEPVVETPLVLRTFVRGQDEDEHVRLMRLAGFSDWSAERIDACFERMVGDGLYVIEDPETGRLVATSMATHKPTDLHPDGGELGWVAGDPAYGGKGLGMAVCAAVSRHFVDAGYHRIYLSTDDWRLPAIKVYLRLGYQPLLYDDTMKPRWQAVYDKLGWPGAVG